MVLPKYESTSDELKKALDKLAEKIPTLTKEEKKAVEEST